MRNLILLFVLVGNVLCAQTLSINISPDSVSICQTSSVSLEVFVENPSGPYSYSWSNGGGNSKSANFQGSNLSLGINKIYVTVTQTQTGGSSLTGIDSAIINVVQLANAGSISGPDNICIDSFRSLIPTVPGGQWKSLNSNILTVNSEGKIKGLSSGVATIQYTVLGSPCPDVSTSKTIAVNTPPTPANITGPNSLCLNVSDTLFTFPAMGSWVALNPMIATISTSGVITPLSPGKANFRYAISGGGICTDAITEHAVEIISLPLKPAMEVIHPSTCMGANGSIKLTSPNYIASKYLIKYELNNIPFQKEIGPVNNELILNNLTSGTYKIISIKNIDSGCELDNINESRTLMDPLRPSKPEIVVDKTTSCGPAIFSFTTSNNTGYSYRWKLDGITQFGMNNMYFANLSSVKKYAITLSQTQVSTNCTSDETIKEVEVYPAVTVLIQGKSEVCEGYDEKLEAEVSSGGGEYKYKWSTLEITNYKDLKLLQDGVYSFGVTVVDKNNCSNYTEKTVTINDVPEVKIKQLNLFSFDLDGTYSNLIAYKYKIVNTTLNKDTTTEYSSDSQLIFGFDGKSSYDVQMIFITDNDCEGYSSIIRVVPNPVECSDAKIEILLPENNKIAFLSNIYGDVKYCEKFLIDLEITGGIKDKILQGDVLVSARNVQNLTLSLMGGKFAETIKGIELDKLPKDSIKLDFNFKVPNTGSVGTKNIKCEFLIGVSNDFKPDIILDSDTYCYNDTIYIPLSEKSGKKTNFILDTDNKSYTLPTVREIPLKLLSNVNDTISYTLKSIKADNNICGPYDKTYTVHVRKSPIIPNSQISVCNSIGYKTNVFEETGVVYKWSNQGIEIKPPFTGSEINSGNYYVTATLTYGTLLCETEGIIKFVKDEPIIGSISAPSECSPYFTINTFDNMNNTTLTWLYNNSDNNISYPFMQDRRLISLTSMQKGGKLKLVMKRGTCIYMDSVIGTQNFNYEEDLRKLESDTCGDNRIYFMPEVNNDCFIWYTYDSTSLQLKEIEQEDQKPFVSVSKGQKTLATSVNCDDNCNGTIFTRIKEEIGHCAEKEEDDGFKIYPIPAVGSIFLESNKAFQLPTISRLFDATGRTIKQINYNFDSSGKYEIDVSDIQSGFYFINIGSNNYKIIINR